MGIKKLKILVAGHFGAGKTTFVRTLTSGRILETDKKTTLKEEKERKRTTTVAMDFGEYEREGIKFAIFGIPGQERFSFMWPIVAKNSAGIIYLLDSTDSSRWYEVFKQHTMFRKILPDAPFIFAANKQDLPNAMSLEEIQQKLKLPNWVKLVSTVALDRESVENTLNVLVEEFIRKKTGAVIR